MRGFRAVRLVVQGLCLGLAGGLFAAGGISEAWIQAHILPDFTVSPAGRIAREVLARGVLFVGALIALLALWRSRRWLSAEKMRADLATAGRIAVALSLALVAGEVVLRTVFWRPFDPLCCAREPLRQGDPVLGWQPVPSRTAHIAVAGRQITYTFDARGRRIKDAAAIIDEDRPSILFAGESFMMGYKLPWDETIPAQVEAMAGLQSVNLAVEGYSSAQAYLRLEAELPRFRRPVAIVFLFLPSVFRKELDRMRPRLDVNLTPLAVDPPLRLLTLAHWLVPYESAKDIEQGIAVAQNIQRAVAALASSRDAVALTLLPDVAEKRAGEIVVRQRVLDEAGLPYVPVALQPDWHVPEDEHPDARADHAMAKAITDALRSRCPSCIPPPDR